MATSQFPNHRPSPDTDAGFAELIQQLTDDSKRLAGNEVRLAKLEMAEHVRTGGRGAMELGIAFGAGVVALSALTICGIAAIAAAVGKLWIGAIVIGVVELVVGLVCVQQGVRTLGRVSYSLPETRASLRETESWVAAPRAD
jgi:hypothetical protein